MPIDIATRLAATADELGRRFAARAADHDEHDRFVADNYAEIKAAGLLEAGVPSELGGGGAGPAELSTMLRTLAHHCGSTALALSMHTHQVAIAAWRWRHRQVTAMEPLLKRVAAERIVLLSSGGSDWIAGSGRAERVDGGYRITARKVFASGAPAADLMLTMAVLDAEGPNPTVLHFALPMKSPHVKVLDTWRTLGMRGTGSHDVQIDGHVVPDAAVSLQRPAGQWHPVFQVIATVAIPLIYSVYVGVAESARDIALELARKRRSDASVTGQVGRVETALRGAQLALASMFDVVARNDPNAQSVNDVMIARALLVEQAVRCVELALEAAGAAGFYRAAGLERRFRDIQGARYHPMQPGQQAQYAGSMALGLPVDRLF
jgi:alkylation response protein AidB-like acyl-CoA dehydrogenase